MKQLKKSNKVTKITDSLRTVATLRKAPEGCRLGIETKNLFDEYIKDKKTFEKDANNALVDFSVHAWAKKSASGQSW